MSVLEIRAMSHVNLSEIRSFAEDWTGKTKPSERKKLQNRLNQRALRKRRLAREQERSSTALTPGNVIRNAQFEPSHTEVSVRAEPTQSPFNVQNWLEYTRSPTSASRAKCAVGSVGGGEGLKAAIVIARESYHHKQPNTQHLLDVLRFNVFYAFAHNARAMGFDDAWLRYEAVSPLCTGAVTKVAPFPNALPPSLVPTDLQYDIEHHPWIDFLPCPKMRDNFLRRLRDFGEDYVDEDSLCVDLVDAASARRPDDVCLVTWGLPWETSGWEVTEAFWEKWPWLLEGCNELLLSTNYWRRKRGLHRLEIRSCYT